MRSTPITLEMLKTGNFYFLHTQLSEFWTTDIFEECERVGFHPWKHFPCHSSFLEEFISWGCTSSLFFFAALSYLFILIYHYSFFSEQEWWSVSNSAFSGHIRDLFLRLTGMHESMHILHIAHLCSYCIVFLWFWLIMWGEFLGRVLDWNVETNQWQIAWTHSNWHL